MSFLQRISKSHSGNTVLNILVDTSLYGETCRSLFQTAHHALKSLENYKVLHLNSLFCVVKKLEDTLLLWKPDKQESLLILWDLHFEIQEVAKRDFENEKSCRNTEVAKWIRDLILQHAIEILQRFIASFKLLPRVTAQVHEKGEVILQMKGIALEVLHTICVEFEDLAKLCAEKDIFVHSLFSYLQFDQTCFPACKVLECLMLAKKHVFDLGCVAKLQQVVMGLQDIQLGNFCKILAITLSELDMYENKTSLYAQTKQKKNQNFYIRDTNQDVILRIPNILSRLVNIACAKPYVPWYPSGYVESEQWLRWIDDQLTQDMNDDEVEESEIFIGGVTQWSEYSSQGPVKMSVKMTLELRFRADAVCVLGLLLVGRHRKEVQKKLADLKLIPQLSDLFDHFIWRTNTRDYTRLPGHNSSCECSPEVALKIQVLRLIHSFCDHSDYKHAMLSWSEYSEIQTIEELSDSDIPVWMSREVMCVGIKGLLSKIVEIIKRETGASTFRFWLSRAIESYLRGSFSSADQDFLLRRNLLQHVTQNLITSNVRHKEVLQSSFDLLGELVKFNISAFEELNTHVYSNARQKKLVSLMNSSLVDSNMFIRSLILSYELFITSGDEDLKAFAEECCYVLSHVGNQKTRVSYLQKLLTLINIHNLTQENVSCLNTALVILMYGQKKGELPHYLKFLSSHPEGCSVATNSTPVHLDNLRDLLLFWQDHYLQKDKDCTILEKSSRICFQEWRNTVSLLTSEDFKNPCTIAFYTVRGVSIRAS